MVSDKIIYLDQFRQAIQENEDKEKNDAYDAQRRLDRIITSSVESAYITNQPIVDHIMETLWTSIYGENHEIDPEEKEHIKNEIEAAMKNCASFTIVSLVNALSDMYPYIFPES